MKRRCSGSNLQGSWAHSSPFKAVHMERKLVLTFTQSRRIPNRIWTDWEVTILECAGKAILVGRCGDIHETIHGCEECVSLYVPLHFMIQWECQNYAYVLYDNTREGHPIKALHTQCKEYNF